MEKYSDLLEDSSVNIAGWIKASQELTATRVYPDKLPNDNRPYCKQNKDDLKEDDIPVLDKKYADAGVQIVEKQIVLGGVHLAAVLKSVFGTSNSRPPTEENILKTLKMKNTSQDR